MAKESFQWNLDELESSCNAIRRQIEALEDNLKFLHGFARDVAQAWQTPAGEIYSKHLNINTTDLKVILGQMEDFMHILGMVRRDCYEKAENDIARRIATLHQNCH